MKVTLVFKTPDVLDQLEYPKGFESADKEQLDTVKELVEKFVEYGEYLQVEFDSEKQTATVLLK